jgi:hypothetical protein
VSGATSHSPEFADDWPAPRHGDLLNGLSRYLAPDAGLRDTMLHAEHAALTCGLGRHLDIQAGLAALRALPPAAASRRTPDQPATAASSATSPTSATSRATSPSRVTSAPPATWPARQL